MHISLKASQCELLIELVRSKKRDGVLRIVNRMLPLELRVYDGIRKIGHARLITPLIGFKLISIGLLFAHCEASLCSSEAASLLPIHVTQIIGVTSLRRPSVTFGVREKDGRSALCGVGAVILSLKV